MSRFLGTLAVFAMLVTGASAYAGEFGSIAYSGATGQVGWSFNYDSRWQAEAEARNACGACDCQSVLWVSNQCAALAVGWDGTRYGYGFGATADQAMYRATEGCSQSDVGCHAVRWVCSGT